MNLLSIVAHAVSQWLWYYDNPNNPAPNWTDFDIELHVGGVTVKPTDKADAYTLHVVHKFGPSFCEQCNADTFPTCVTLDLVVPCSDHQTYCYKCKAIIDQTDACPTCSKCDSCCQCVECPNCGTNVQSHNLCDDCGKCDIGDDCCDGHWPALPWEERGVRLPNRSDELPNSWRILEEEARIRQLDPVEAMADFYLVEYVHTVLDQSYRYGTTLHNGTRDAHLLKLDAIRLQQSIVNRADGLFQSYLFAAIGGEVRHHQDIRCRRHYMGRGPGRGETWDLWCAMADDHEARLGMAQDCVNYFQDGTWGGSYGGKAWATIAQTLVQRWDGTLDAKTFVDRVFSLQHNGGSALNKITWPVLNGMMAYVDGCRKVGDAHHSTNLLSLCAYASDDAKLLFAGLLAHHSSRIPESERHLVNTLADFMNMKEGD